MDSNGSAIFVKHVGDDQFSIAVREHEVTVDQQRVDEGDDAGPTPTELFVASLASCVAFYARRFLHARGLPDAVDVSARWRMGLRPARVTRIAIRIVAPGVPADRGAAFRRAIEHCTVHNSLSERPDISFEIVTAKEPDAAAS